MARRFVHLHDPGAESCPHWRKIVIRACSDDRASMRWPSTRAGPPNSQRDYIERPILIRGLAITEGLVDPLDENVWTNPLRSSRTLWLNISLKGTNFELLIRILDIRYLISFVAINFFFVILILTIVLYNNSFISMLFNIINANTKYDKN